MSYLDSLRLHFSGRFQADVSTVNNHPAHYNNATFDRTIHWQSGAGGSPQHGWWHPEGTHRFRFTNVVIHKAMMADGSVANPATDPVYQLIVESRGPRAAKMADLDPDQQMVSMIFGLQLALSNDDTGEIACLGDVLAAPFADIWHRGRSGSGDEAANVFYQSKLNVSSWGDLSQSPFLQALKAAAGNLLSIKFNLDGYSMKKTSPGFTMGRIVGTIGPATVDEPVHWVDGRHLGSEVFDPGSASPGFSTTSGVNYCVAVYDQLRKKVRIDLGNALPVDPAGGPIPDLGELTLAVHKSDGSVQAIDKINYGTGSWYEETAAIVEVPAGRELTSAESALIDSSPLCVTVKNTAGNPVIVIEEPQSHVRADMFVKRMNPTDTFIADLRATRFGKTLAGATINFSLLVPPGVADFPVGGLSFPASVICDLNGRASVTFTAADPGNPRYFYADSSPRVHVDGQIYFVAYQLVINGTETPTANPSDYFSILVWNFFVPDNPPTWHGSMRPIFTQYGNLYPWMTKFGPMLDLADYDQIAVPANRNKIKAVLSAGENDPSYMPVTRDLSQSRKSAMLQWLTNLGADGKPLLGTVPPAAPVGAAIPQVVTGGLEATDRGGKSRASLSQLPVRWPH